MTQKTIAFISLAGLCVYLLLWAVAGWESYRFVPLWVVIAIGGGTLVFDLLKRALAKDFSSDLLAGISIVTAVILNEPLAASIVVLMLSGGTALERFATERASSSLQALARRMPHQAFKKSDQGLQKVEVDSIQPGDQIVIMPQDICPADGVVVEGFGTMDEAFITGEPYQISKAPGAAVVSGAINGETAITIEVVRSPRDSRYAKIAQVMQDTLQRRMSMRRMADTLGAWYTPFALSIAVLTWIISGDPTRMLSVLVIATPCPLLIAIPVAIIGTVSLAARRGLIVRDPRVLERLPTCRTIILDKTGTLTYGRPTLVKIHRTTQNFKEEELLSISATLEQYSKHPLAIAVMQACRERGISIKQVERLRRQAGIGLTGQIDGREVLITNRKKALEIGTKNVELLPEAPPGLECVLVINQVLEAAYWFRDEPREKTDTFVSHLSSNHSFDKIMLVSGDREEEVRYLAQRVGIKEIYGGQTPEDKIRIVREESAKAPTFFLGDGINDAPALLAATVGAAFGYQSEITAEAAGVVIMDSALEKVDELFHIAQHMRTIALQSAVGGMLLSVVGMFIAAFGYLPPVSGALFQEVIDVLAVMNALRTLKEPKTLVDF